MLWKILLVLVSLPLLLSMAAVLGNGVSLLSPPGLSARLSVYLTRNVAELAPDHVFAELQNPEYSWSAEQLHERAHQAATGLGWSIESEKEAELIHAVVATPLLGFKDDVQIRAESLASGGSRLQVRSASRQGKADFGANVRHVRDLIAAIGEPQ